MTRTPRRSKAPIAIRVEAEELARIAAADREQAGDFDGAIILRGLADQIKAIRLSEPW